MKEYEYSFIVKSVEPFIDYCKNNKFSIIEDFYQERTLYRNPNKTLARITVNKKGDKISKVLDFKDDILGDDKTALERRETLPLTFTDDKTIDSMLEFLKYKKDLTLIRKRKTFEQNGVKFEIDEYISPEKKLVVAIEGDKVLVDEIYAKLKKYI